MDGRRQTRGGARIQFRPNVVEWIEESHDGLAVAPSLPPRPRLTVARVFYSRTGTRGLGWATVIEASSNRTAPSILARPSHACSMLLCSKAHVPLMLACLLCFVVPSGNAIHEPRINTPPGPLDCPLLLFSSIIYSITTTTSHHSNSIYLSSTL